MAERITYHVSITPGRNTMQNTTLDNESDDDLVISDTNVVALRRFIRQLTNIEAEPITSIITPINTVPDPGYPIPTI